MTKEYISKWVKAALIRAVRTFAQVMLSMIVVGNPIAAIDWKNAFSVAAVAALTAIFTAFAGLPEVDLPAEMKHKEADK